MSEIPVETLHNRQAKSNIHSFKKRNKMVKKKSILSDPSKKCSSSSDSISDEASIDSSTPVNMPLPLSVSESDLTPSSTITICDTMVEGTGQTIMSVESELAVKQLKESMVQVLKSRDVDSRSKKILDAVVNAVMEDLPGIGISDGDWFNQLASMKVAVVLLSFLGVIIAIQFFIASHQHAPFGPAPT